MVPFIWRLCGRLVRLICPFFFEKVGAGTMCAGRIRLPMPLRRVRLGARCMVGDSVFFQTGRASEIVIGDDVSLNTGTHVVAAKSIRIENRNRHWRVCFHPGSGSPFHTGHRRLGAGVRHRVHRDRRKLLDRARCPNRPGQSHRVGLHHSRQFRGAGQFWF